MMTSLYKPSLLLAGPHCDLEFNVTDVYLTAYCLVSCHNYRDNFYYLNYNNCIAANQYTKIVKFSYTYIAPYYNNSCFKVLCYTVSMSLYVLYVTLHLEGKYWLNNTAMQPMQQPSRTHTHTFLHTYAKQRLSRIPLSKYYPSALSACQWVYHDEQCLHSQRPSPDTLGSIWSSERLSKILRREPPQPPLPTKRKSIHQLL